jgi:hypothetical protein
MRVAIVAIGVVLLIVFLGGAVNLGRLPLFGYIDSALGTTALMNLHYTVFSILYGDDESGGSLGEGTRANIDDMAKKAEFGKRKKYQQLDKASQY